MHKNSKGFTLVEIMTTSFIALYVIMAAWSVYIMGWRWWHETSPLIESQRAARVALTYIREGIVDSTVGQDTVAFTTYNRRNGISWAALTNTNPTPLTPVVSDDQHRIDFRLEPDTANIRSFYLGTDAGGKKALYYVDSAGAVHKVNTTEGITDLVFEFDPNYINLLKITVRVERDVAGTRVVPYHISIEYSDYIFLRNI